MPSPLDPTLEARLEQVFRAEAASRQRDGELEFDSDPRVSLPEDPIATGGAYVQGWVWIDLTDQMLIDAHLACPLSAGWEWFEVDSGEYEIQRVDELDQFASDDAALDHVGECAFCKQKRDETNPYKEK